MPIHCFHFSFHKKRPSRKLLDGWIQDLLLMLTKLARWLTPMWLGDVKEFTTVFTFQPAQSLDLASGIEVFKNSYKDFSLNTLPLSSRVMVSNWSSTTSLTYMLWGKCNLELAFCNFLANDFTSLIFLE